MAPHRRTAAVGALGAQKQLVHQVVEHVGLRACRCAAARREHRRRCSICTAKAANGSNTKALSLSYPARGLASVRATLRIQCCTSAQHSPSERSRGAAQPRRIIIAYRGSGRPRPTARGNRAAIRMVVAVVPPTGARVLVSKPADTVGREPTAKLLSALTLSHSSLATHSATQRGRQALCASDSQSVVHNISRTRMQVRNRLCILKDATYTVPMRHAQLTQTAPDFATQDPCAPPDPNMRCGTRQPCRACAHLREVGRRLRSLRHSCVAFSAPSSCTQ